METKKKLLFQCHSCKKTFVHTVTITSEKSLSQITRTINCSYCDISCRITLGANEVLAIPVFRDGNSTTNAPSTLENQVFPTQPVT